MDIINPLINHYLDTLLPHRPKVYQEMEARAARENFPAISPQVGTLLELLARAIGARRIIDLGSGFGYSGLWLARALPPDGQIILTDQNPENRQLAQQYFQRLGLQDKLDFRLGNALEIFRSLFGPFDLVFNDVDKEDYPTIIDLAFDRLRPGGLLITDNTLWSGQVTEANPYEPTQAIQKHNRMLAEHTGFLTVQLSIRDGVSVSWKKG